MSRDLPRPRLAGSAHSTLQPADWISVQARHQPGKACMVEGDGTTWTFGEINGRVNRLARALQAQGIERGDRIGILATDSVDYMVLLMASLKLGTTYVPLNYRLALGEIANLAEHGDLDAYVTMARYADSVELIRSRCPRLRVVASFDEIPSLVHVPTIGALIEGCDDASDIEVLTEPEDVIGLMFTSGTTGRPKGVMQSMRMLRASTGNALIDFRFLPDEFRYSASPMFHCAGMGCVFYGLARGFTSLILEQYDPATLLHWMSEGGLTGILAMPTMLHALLNHPGARDRTYPRLRAIAYGGSPIAPAMLRDAIRVFGCGFFNSFGAGTEAAGQAMFYPEDHERALAGEEHLLGSIGRPMYGVELRLCDDELRDVAPGEIGEICTRSDSVMSGYLGDPERTAQAVVDGWFRAGDLARMDKDGFLFLAGRKNDMIIRGGENVYPVEIESVIAEHPSVDLVSVVGLPDDHWGEIVAAAIIPVAGATIDADAIRAHCREHLAAYKVPAQVFTVDDMPRNVNGKVQKHLLAEQLAPSTPRLG